MAQLLLAVGAVLVVVTPLLEFGGGLRAATLERTQHKPATLDLQTASRADIERYFDEMQEWVSNAKP